MYRHFPIKAISGYISEFGIFKKVKHGKKTVFEQSPIGEGGGGRNRNEKKVAEGDNINGRVVTLRPITFHYSRVWIYKWTFLCTCMQSDPVKTTSVFTTLLLLHQQFCGTS
jgi:hypothetical protein